MVEFVTDRPPFDVVFGPPCSNGRQLSLRSFSVSTIYPPLNWPYLVLPCECTFAWRRCTDNLHISYWFCQGPCGNIRCSFAIKMPFFHSADHGGHDRQVLRFPTVLLRADLRRSRVEAGRLPLDNGTEQQCATVSSDEGCRLTLAHSRDRWLEKSESVRNS